MAYVHEFPMHMLLYCMAPLLKSEAFISAAFPFQRHLTGFWCNNVFWSQRGRGCAFLLFNSLFQQKLKLLFSTNVFQFCDLFSGGAHTDLQANKDDPQPVGRLHRLLTPRLYLCQACHRLIEDTLPLSFKRIRLGYSRPMKIQHQQYVTLCVCQPFGNNRGGGGDMLRVDVDCLRVRMHNAVQSQ